MPTYLNQRIFKILVLLFIICNSGYELFAQTSIQYLEGAALEKAVYENVQKGLPSNDGINVQYNIGINQIEEASKQPSEIIAEIKKIPGIIDCTIDIQNKRIIVKCPKERNNDNPAKIKGKLALLDIRMLNCEEHYYKN